MSQVWSAVWSAESFSKCIEIDGHINNPSSGGTEGFGKSFAVSDDVHGSKRGGVGAGHGILQVNVDERGLFGVEFRQGLFSGNSCIRTRLGTSVAYPDTCPFSA
jgi:hypothetical protein